MIIHPIEPVFDNESRVLILGSFPSVKSREAMFFYGHPQNRFWKVIASLCNEEIPTTVEEKKVLLLRNHIAVWDVIAQCDIQGSSDSSVKNVETNDHSVIHDNAQIRAIYVNGKTAEKYYRKYIEKTINRKAICLPSTSPANAAWSMERLMDEWRVILDNVSTCHC